MLAAPLFGDGSAGLSGDVAATLFGNGLTA
jgi:hypothetical protein